VYLSSYITFKGRLQSAIWMFFFSSCLLSVLFHSSVPKPRTPICFLAGGLGGKPVAESRVGVAVAFYLQRACLGQLWEGCLDLGGNSVSAATESIAPCTVSPLPFYLTSCMLNNTELFASACIFVPSHNVLAFLRFFLV